MNIILSIIQTIQRFIYKRMIFQTVACIDIIWKQTLFIGFIIVIFVDILAAALSFLGVWSLIKHRKHRTNNECIELNTLHERV